MPNIQSIDIPRDPFHNDILELEKRYFNLIYDILDSDEFKHDLLLIEKEIRENYGNYNDIWIPKNKIKVPAERIVRHYLYTKLHNISKIFPSPASSDFGVKTDDCILCVDVKTIDINGNKGDLRSTQVEANQTSFNNKNYPGIKYKQHLISFEDRSGLPVLSYIVKIIYDDNKHRFELCRNIEYKTVCLACIPNGQLSFLFDYNIIDNYKTYIYHNDYEEIVLPPKFCKYKKKKKKDICDKKCINERGFIDVSGPLKKDMTYFDANREIYWTQTKKENRCCIRAIKGGSSVRFNNKSLKNRFDSNNVPWDGFKSYIIDERLH